MIERFAAAMPSEDQLQHRVTKILFYRLCQISWIYFIIAGPFINICNPHESRLGPELDYSPQLPGGLSATEENPQLRELNYKATRRLNKYQRTGERSREPCIIDQMDWKRIRNFQLTQQFV